MRNRIIASITTLTLALVLGADAVPAVNLLRNGDLTELDGKGAPKGWTLTTQGQTVALDETERPEGTASSLRIDIKNEGSSQGSISQKLQDVPTNVKLVLTAQAKATTPGIVFLQIKGKQAGKETMRENSQAISGSHWEELRLEVDTGEADELSVQARFRQGDEAVGQTVWIAKMQLFKAE